MKKLVCILMAAAMLLMCGCSDGDGSGSSGYVLESFAEDEIDYTDDAEFEAALNRGEDLVGKVVRFKVNEIHPDSFYGYNLWAGEHLNFIFPSQLDVKAGDEVTVKVSTVSKLPMGTYTSWIINDSESTDNSGKSSDYTKELKFDNISLFLPENAVSNEGDNYTNYYTDDGMLTLVVSDSPVPTGSINLHSSVYTDSFLEGIGDNLKYYDYRFLNGIAAVYTEIEVTSDGRTSNGAGLMFTSSNQMISIIASGDDSLESAQKFLSKILSHMKINGESVTMTKADSKNSDKSSSKDDSSAAEPKELEKSFTKFTVSGTGSKVTKDISLPPVLCVVHAEHSGSRNFIVHYYSASGYRDSLSNEIGVVNSYQIYDATSNGATDGGMLEVDADGRWSITFIPLADYVSNGTKTSFSGRGDAVVGCFTANGMTVCKGTHRGDHNFVVHVYEYSETGDRVSMAFNEIGTYSGETVLRTEAGKKYFFNVMADGNWTLDLDT